MLIINILCLTLLSLPITGYAHGSQLDEEHKQMRSAAIEVLDIVVKDSTFYRRTTDKFKIYYKNNTPETVQDILTFIAPVAKIINDKEITLYRKEF